MAGSTKDIKISIKKKKPKKKNKVSTVSEGGLDLYFGGGGQGYVTGGVGVLSLFLRCLNSHQGREGCGEVTA